MLSDRHRNSSALLLCIHSCGARILCLTQTKAQRCRLFMGLLQGAGHGHAYINASIHLTRLDKPRTYCTLPIVVTSLLQVTASSLDQSWARFCVNSAWEKCPPMTFHPSESDASRQRPSRLYRAVAGASTDHQDVFYDCN